MPLGGACSRSQDALSSTGLVSCAIERPSQREDAHARVRSAPLHTRTSTHRALARQAKVGQGWCNKFFGARNSERASFWLGGVGAGAFGAGFGILAVINLWARGGHLGRQPSRASKYKDQSRGALHLQRDKGSRARLAPDVAAACLLVALISAHGCVGISYTAEGGLTDLSATPPLPSAGPVRSGLGSGDRCAGRVQL